MRFCRACYSGWRWVPGVLVTEEPAFECPNCGCKEYTTLSDVRRPGRPINPIRDAKIAEALNRGDKEGAKRIFEEYAKADKAETTVVWSTPELLEALRAEAKATGKDFYRLVAAKENGVEYDAVTKEQRDIVKVKLFAYTYGSR